jgi:hypothetical protein
LTVGGAEVVPKKSPPEIGGPDLAPSGCAANHP